MNGMIRGYGKGKSDRHLKERYERQRITLLHERNFQLNPSTGVRPSAGVGGRKGDVILSNEPILLLSEIIYCSPPGAQFRGPGHFRGMPRLCRVCHLHLAFLDTGWWRVLAFR